MARATLNELVRRYSLPAGAGHRLGVLLDALAAEVAPTSVHDPATALDVHVADSLVGLEAAALRDASTIADLGAGAGLPGLVLAAALPHARVFLVDSVGRKCAFMRATAAAMGLDNVAVVEARIEEWRDGREACDVVCARALAALPVLCEYAAPLLRLGGVLVAWKAQVDDREAVDGLAAAAQVGLEPDAVVAVRPFPGSVHRTLHVLRKTRPTPPRFPRRAGFATKRPLSVQNLR
jgi:16S rRNA (guanine527-N7)-methyltransferase